MGTQILTLLTDYIGSDPFNDLLVTEELTKSFVSDEKQKLPSVIIKSKDYSPGQSVRIGQRGYDLAVYSWSFNGQPAGHIHGGNYNGGLPSEARFSSGQYTEYILGAACGIINESITVYLGGQTGSATGQGRIIIPGLNSLQPSPSIKLIGATTVHPDNHYGTADANSKILAIANEYYQKTSKPLWINDMSLAWGGMFDISGQYSPPHKEHTSGTSVDIAATKAALTKEKVFVEILRRYTTNYILEYDTDPSKRHYHIRF